MIRGACLCGAISVRHAAPSKLVRCNCSACRRYGAVWAHGTRSDITIKADGPLTRFVRQDCDGDLTFVSCATCGTTTHWEPTVNTGAPDRLAMNAALCDPSETTNLPLRHFDGADTWTFLD